MSTVAFTNREGYNEKLELRQGRVKGVSFNEPVDMITSTNLVKVASNYKSPTVKGDHHSPLGYTREIVNLIDDAPFSYHQRFKPGADVLWDLTWDEYLSTHYDIVNMLPPVRYRNLMDNALDAALTIARERLRDSNNRASMGSAIGTAKQTAHEMASNSLNVLNSLRALRKGQFAQAAAHLGLDRRSVLTGKSAANAWLQWVYGAKPVLQDIHDQANLIHGINRGEGFTFTASSKRSVTFTSSVDPSSTFAETWDCEGGVKVAYKARITNSYLDSLDTSGVLNPLSVIWDIVPYSFVVDWFIPVGNVLESLTATAGLEFASGYISSKEDWVFRSSLQNWGAPGTYDIRDKGNMSVAVMVNHRRTLSDFALPHLYANTNPFSSTHIANAVALIRNMAGNGPSLR